jgi:hypothetical protein
VSVVINQPGDSTLTDNVRSFIVQKSNASTLEKVTVQIKQITLVLILIGI